MKTVMMATSRWHAVQELVKRAAAADSCVAITTSLIESRLGLEKGPADNDRVSLRFFGLINQGAGVLTALGRRWIDDESYLNACKEIIDRCYPQGTVQALSSGGESFVVAIECSCVNGWVGRPS